VPLFAGYAPTYRVRAAEAQVEAQQARTERVRLQVALDVWNAYQNLVTATQSMRTSADLLGSATQSERVALGRYRAGVGNMLDVLNAQSVLASARQQRIQSMLDWNIGRAVLAQAMGSLDSSLLQTLSPASPLAGRGGQGLAPRDSISGLSPVAPEKARP
jgi:outer membrane protein TolC